MLVGPLASLSPTYFHNHFLCILVVSTTAIPQKGISRVPLSIGFRHHRQMSLPSSAIQLSLEFVLVDRQGIMAPYPFQLIRHEICHMLVGFAAPYLGLFVLDANRMIICRFVPVDGRSKAASITNGSVR